MSSIERLKSLISKKGGLAKGNRFNVIFTPPKQTLLNFDLESIVSSAISGNFSAKNLINDPRDISMLCDSVSIPGKQISTIDYQAQKQSIKIPYGTLHDDVSLTFLLTNDYYMKSMFDQWINNIVNTDTYGVAYKRDIVTDVIIQQLDEQNTPIYGVKLEGAFPTTMNEIVLSNDSTDTIQKLNVSFSYDRYVPQGALSSTGSAIRSALSIFG
jgi:hypothetical protein|tara:strand:+ start:606 stop:1244 length:639 start_codon:yes stop_codon:yes gene_type:complete